MKTRAGWIAGMVLVIGLALAGCRKPAEVAGGEVPVGRRVAERSFQTRGVVREVSADGSKAVIRHEEIPDYMPAMTMELNVGDPGEVRALRPGDVVEFRLNVEKATHWIDQVRKTGGALVAVESPPAAKPVAADGLLEVGSLFPDVELLDEDGRRFRLSEYRGRAVALTFIFTRCPLPDFCPRMGVQFAGARKQLKAAGGRTNWMFLSVSFDPEQDRPEVLKRYAGTYRGGDADRWLFSVADRDAMGAMGPRVGLTVVADVGGFSHNLRTVVLDGAGRLHRRLDGNLWTAAELAAAMQAAAGAGK